MSCTQHIILKHAFFLWLLLLPPFQAQTYSNRLKHKRLVPNIYKLVPTSQKAFHVQIWKSDRLTLCDELIADCYLNYTSQTVKFLRLTAGSMYYCSKGAAVTADCLRSGEKGNSWRQRSSWMWRHAGWRNITDVSYVPRASIFTVRVLAMKASYFEDKAETIWRRNTVLYVRRLHSTSATTLSLIQGIPWPVEQNIVTENFEVQNYKWS